MELRGSFESPPWEVTIKTIEPGEQVIQFQKEWPDSTTTCLIHIPKNLKETTLQSLQNFLVTHQDTIDSIVDRSVREHTSELDIEQLKTYGFSDLRISEGTQKASNFATSVVSSGGAKKNEPTANVVEPQSYMEPFTQGKWSAEIPPGPTRSIFIKQKWEEGLSQVHELEIPQDIYEKNPAILAIIRDFLSKKENETIIHDYLEDKINIRQLAQYALKKESLLTETLLDREFEMSVAIRVNVAKRELNLLADKHEGKKTMKKEINDLCELYGKLLINERGDSNVVNFQTFMEWIITTPQIDPAYKTKIIQLIAELASKSNKDVYPQGIVQAIDDSLKYLDVERVRLQLPGKKIFKSETSECDLSYFFENKIQELTPEQLDELAESFENMLNTIQRRAEPIQFSSENITPDNILIYKNKDIHGKEHYNVKITHFGKCKLYENYTADKQHSEQTNAIENILLMKIIVLTAKHAQYIEIFKEFFNFQNENERRHLIQAIIEPDLIKYFRSLNEECDVNTLIRIKRALEAYQCYSNASYSKRFFSSEPRKDMSQYIEELENRLPGRRSSEIEVVEVPFEESE